MPRTTTAATLLAGDLLALFGFVAVGQFKHGYLFWEYPARTVLILSPIVGSWLVVAPLVGLATERSLERHRETALRLIPAWVLVASANGLLRDTSVVPGSAPPTFFAVSVLFGLFFLGGWRLLAPRLL